MLELATTHLQQIQHLLAQRLPHPCASALNAKVSHFAARQHTPKPRPDRKVLHPKHPMTMPRTFPSNSIYVLVLPENKKCTYIW